MNTLRTIFFILIAHSLHEIEKCFSKIFPKKFNSKAKIFIIDASQGGTLIL